MCFAEHPHLSSAWEGSSGLSGDPGFSPMQRTVLHLLWGRRWAHCVSSATHTCPLSHFVTYGGTDAETKLRCRRQAPSRLWKETQHGPFWTWGPVGACRSHVTELALALCMSVSFRPAETLKTQYSDVNSTLQWALFVLGPVFRTSSLCFEHSVSLCKGDTPLHLCG
jgi:hypothetical protein